jgi:hypothetical protein
MATYDQTQSLPVNLQLAGLIGNPMGMGDIDPQFLSAIQTAFARAGRQGYGGQEAFNLLSGADQQRAQSDPFGYANELLAKSGISGFSNIQDLSAANTALPGHNESFSPFNPVDVVSGLGDVASDLASEPGFLALAGTAAGGSMLGGPAGGGAAAGGTAAMPAAIPETAATLGEWGLAETAPGVFAAGAPAGVSAGYTGAAGAPMGAPPSGPSTALAPGGAGAGISLGQIAAGAIPAAFGAFGANQQARQYGALANQYMAMGAPYRSRLSELYSDPEDWLNSAEVQIPIQQGTNILARSLSTKGNPTGSGNALQELQNYASKQLFDRLGQEKDRLAGFGGLSSYSAAAPSAANAQIGAQKGIYDAIGAGAADIFNPPRRITLQDLMRL